MKQRIVMNPSKSILDLMPESERDKALERARKRMERQSNKKGLDVSPEIYLVAEFGYYFGWDAMMAIRRGYTVAPGTSEKEIFTLEEALVLLEGARKVWYSKITEQTHAGVISNSFKSSSNSFDGAIKPFSDRAEVSK